MADEQAQASSGKLHLVVVSHDRTLLDQQADEVGLPGRVGDLGILPGHAAYVGALRPGLLVLRDGGNTTSAVISAGFCEVLNNEVTVLVDDAQFRDDIDRQTASAALQEAQSQLEHAETEHLETLQDRVALYEAQLQLAS